MIGVFKVAMAVVASRMAGDQLVLMVEAEPVGVCFQRQRRPGQVGRHGVAVSVQGDAKLPGRSHLGHGSDIEGMQRERAEVRLFALP